MKEVVLVIRWLSGFTLKEIKRSTELRALLSLSAVNVLNRPRWLGRVEHKDDGYRYIDGGN